MTEQDVWLTVVTYVYVIKEQVGPVVGNTYLHDWKRKKTGFAGTFTYARERFCCGDLSTSE